MTHTIDSRRSDAVHALNAHRTQAAHERALFQRLAREGTPAARDAIVTRFMPLARQLARRYGRGAELEDLEQVAALALLKAIGRFDPERGLAFSSFAFPTIVGELKRYLRDHAWSVRVPRALQELHLRAERATRELTAELGRAPTPAELAERVDSTVELVLEARQVTTARHAVSLDQRLESDDEGGLVPDVAVEDDGFKTAENSAFLGGLAETLTERERLILRLRFERDLTQTEIGEIVGLSQMQVSRVLRNALARMHAAADTRADGKTPAF